MEKGLVRVVVKVGRNWVEPHNSLSRIDVDQAEPVVVLDTRPLSDPEGSVRVDGNSVPAEYEHAAKTRESPGVCRGTKRSLIDTCGRDGDDFDVRRKIGHDVAFVVLGERRNGGGRRVRVCLNVSHVVN